VSITSQRRRPQTASTVARAHDAAPAARERLIAGLALLEGKANDYWRRDYKAEVAWGSLAAWNAMLPAPLPEDAVIDLFAEVFDQRGTLPYLASWRRQREAQP
jgi:hypothetical protein